MRKYTREQLIKKVSLRIHAFEQKGGIPKEIAVGIVDLILSRGISLAIQKQNQECHSRFERLPDPNTRLSKGD